MATLEQEGTKFSFSVLPLRLFSDGYWVRTEISVKNEYILYDNISESISREELENWIFSMSRLLAGAYGSEYKVSFEKAGMTVDLRQYTNPGKEFSREERRASDCTMAVHLLMRSSDGIQFWGGVYSFLFHRKEIEEFVSVLKKEFDEAFSKCGRGKGRYLFVGVSPKGYKGCNYWYLDKTGTVAAGDYVWVRMGRHNTEQVVYVDSIRYYDEDDASYNPKRVKQVLRKATEEEAWK